MPDASPDFAKRETSCRDGPSFDTPTLKNFVLRPEVRALLGAAATALLLLVAWQQRHQLLAMLHSASPPWLVASIFLGILANSLTGGLLHLFLRHHGVEVRLPAAARLQLIAQLGKYIPGKVWGSILQAQVTGSQKLGSFLLAGLELSIYLMLGLAGLGLSLLAFSRFPWVAFLLAIAAIGVPSAIANRAAVPRMALRFSRPSNAYGSQDAIHPQPASHFAMAGAIHAIVHLASILALLVGILGADREVLVVGTASLLLSWVVGNLAVIFPSGIGAREVAFVAIAHWLSMPADVATITLIAILARVAQVAQDLVTAVIVAPYLVTGAGLRGPN